MAKVEINLIVQGLSGKVGRDLMFRRLRDGRTILCQKPDFSNREFSEKQMNHQERFKAAAAYAKAAAKSQPIYAELAAGSMKTAYNLALSDWFHAPEILGCDLDAWTGQAGGCVRIQAVDDVLVTGVQVIFMDEQGAIIVHGEATPMDESWWEFIVPGFPGGVHRMLVSVIDLAGNVCEKTWEPLMATS